MKEASLVQLAVLFLRSVDRKREWSMIPRLVCLEACWQLGLFSTVHDLKIFSRAYLQDDFAADLSQEFSDLNDKEQLIVLES